jgi:hypothetical protein
VDVKKSTSDTIMKPAILKFFWNQDGDGCMEAKLSPENGMGATRCPSPLQYVDDNGARQPPAIPTPSLVRASSRFSERL